MWFYFPVHVSGTWDSKGKLLEFFHSLIKNFKSTNKLSCHPTQWIFLCLYLWSCQADERLMTYGLNKMNNLNKKFYFGFNLQLSLVY